MAYKMLEYLILRILKPEARQKWIQINLISFCNYCLEIMRIQLDCKNPQLAQQLDQAYPIIIVANHSSYADIPIVLMSLNKQAGFLAKVELSKIPFLNYWMREIGCILINRQDPTGALNQILAIQKNRGNATVVVFPEGTRSKDGEIGDFKKGAFRLANNLKAMIIPLVISDSRASWELRKSFRTQHRCKSKWLEPRSFLFNNATEMNLKIEELKTEMQSAKLWLDLN
jgi:1-acyl-sn-glycerol-3-phosphate acyltransferase